MNVLSTQYSNGVKVCNNSMNLLAGSKKWRVYLHVWKSGDLITIPDLASYCAYSLILSFKLSRAKTLQKERGFLLHWEEDGLECYRLVMSGVVAFSTWRFFKEFRKGQKHCRGARREVQTLMHSMPQDSTWSITIFRLIHYMHWSKR